MNLAKLPLIILTIPFLNFLYGFFVGLDMLFTLILTGSVVRVFQGLFLAMIWCLIAVATIFSFATFVLWPFALWGHFLYNRWFLFTWYETVVNEKATVQINKLREEYKGKAEFNQIVGGFGNNPILSFDAEKKLFAFIYDDGYIVKPFGYIKGWTLEWTAVSGTRAKHVKLVLTTTDIDRPIIRVPFDSKAAGESFEAKLSILIG